MQGTIKLFSTSTIHGSGYLDYAEKAVQELFGQSDRVLFIPYARPGGMSHDAYYEVARKRFDQMGISLDSIHLAADPIQALVQCDGIFTGGGNTFVLLRQLYQQQLLEVIRQQVYSGTPYMGSSAGSNIAGLSIGTTNDMPIVLPPSLKALELVPFNLNPHYLDPDPNSTHKGETRETRIKEFHHFNPQPVAGLREGSWLTIRSNKIWLEGPHSMRLFRRELDPVEVAPGDVTPYLNPVA